MLGALRNFLESAALLRWDGYKAAGWYVAEPVAPVAYQVTLEPGIGQFREFESLPVRTPIKSRGLFLAHKLTCGKREGVS